MSDYLVNLARRSAGTAPVAYAPTRVTSLPRTIGSSRSEALVRDSTPPHGTYALPAPTTPITVRSQPVSSDTTESRASILVTALPAIQISNPPNEPTPDTTAVPPHAAVAHITAVEHRDSAARPTTKSDEPSETTVAPKPTRQPTPLLHVLTPPPPVQPGVPGTSASPELAQAPDPPDTPARPLVDEMPHGTPQPLRTVPPSGVDLPRTDAAPLTRLPAISPVSPIAAIESLAPAQRSGSSAQAAVRVHIGTIEIHSAAPVQPIPPAPPVAPVPTPTDGGFAAFSHLRSYAPWER